MIKEKPFSSPDLTLKKLHFFHVWPVPQDISIGIQNQGITHLTSSFSDRSELSMELMNKLINQDNEYWYIGSMFAKSAMVKNKFVE